MTVNANRLEALGPAERIISALTKRAVETMLDTANIEKQIARLMATLPAAQAETECAPLFLELARIHEIRMTARRSKT